MEPHAGALTLLASAGFEPAPSRTAALTQRLRPLGQLTRRLNRTSCNRVLFGMSLCQAISQCFGPVADLPNALSELS